MEEALKILQQMESLLDQMNYLGRQISGIDEGVRNRAYTVRELMEERRIEQERDQVKSEFDENQEKLALAIGTPKNAKELKEMLKNKKAKKEEHGRNIDLFITWINIAEEKIHEEREEIDR